MMEAQVQIKYLRHCERELQNELKKTRKERDELIAVVWDVYHKMKAVAGGVHCIVHLSDAGVPNDIKELMTDKARHISKLSDLLLDSVDDIFVKTRLTDEA